MTEEIDHQTALNLLKEQTKLNKNLGKKLKRLEERYVQKYQESNDLSSDRSNLVSFISGILQQSIDSGAGKVSAEELEKVWQNKEQEQQGAIESLTKHQNEEISKLQEELENCQNLLKAKDLQIESMQQNEEAGGQLIIKIEELKNEIEYLEKNNENLMAENARLKQQSDDISKNRTSSILAALDQQQQPAADTEIQQLKSQLANANSKIAQLEAEIKANEEQNQREIEIQNMVEQLLLQKQQQEEKIQQMHQQLDQIKSEYQGHRKKAQKMVIEKEQNLEKLKRRLKSIEQGNESEQIQEANLRIKELEKMQSHEVVNMEYLRNIVMRFMEYVYASNWKEANTLTFVIFTVLNFNADEMEVIKRAKETSRFVNGVSRMLYPKSPGVGLSYNTIHTMEGRRRANFAPSAEVSMIESSFSNRENYD